MAKKKSAGAGQHRRPAGKRYGPKVASGQTVFTSNVLVTQKGSEFTAGKNVKKGRNFTLYAMIDGIVKFSTRLGKKVVSVVAKK
jgi:large subunit ribosomal protein L27